MLPPFPQWLEELAWTMHLDRPQSRLRPATTGTWDKVPGELQAELSHRISNIFWIQRISPYLFPEPFVSEGYRNSFAYRGFRRCFESNKSARTRIAPPPR